jgi:hypothetical protein
MLGAEVDDCKKTERWGHAPSGTIPFSHNGGSFCKNSSSAVLLRPYPQNTSLNTRKMASRKVPKRIARPNVVQMIMPTPMIFHVEEIPAMGDDDKDGEGSAAAELVTSISDVARSVVVTSTTVTVGHVWVESKVDESEEDGTGGGL